MPQCKHSPISHFYYVFYKWGSFGRKLGFEEAQVRFWKLGKFQVVPFVLIWGEGRRSCKDCLWPLSGPAEALPGTGRARSPLGTLLQHPGLEGCQQVPHLGNWQGKGTPACNCLFHSHANTRNAFCFHGNSVRNKNHHEKLHPSRKEKFNHLEHALLRTPPEAHPRTSCLPNTQQWKWEEDIVTRKRWQGGYSEAKWLSVNLATDKTYFFYNTNFLPRRYIYILIQGY